MKGHKEGGHIAVQGHSRSPILILMESEKPIYSGVARNVNWGASPPLPLTSFPFSSLLPSSFNGGPGV